MSLKFVPAELVHTTLKAAKQAAVPGKRWHTSCLRFEWSSPNVTTNVTYVNSKFLENGAWVPCTMRMVGPYTMEQHAMIVPTDPTRIKELNERFLKKNPGKAPIPAREDRTPAITLKPGTPAYDLSLLLDEAFLAEVEFMRANMKELKRAAMLRKVGDVPTATAAEAVAALKAVTPDFYTIYDSKEAGELDWPDTAAVLADKSTFLRVSNNKITTGVQRSIKSGAVLEAAISRVPIRCKKGEPINEKRVSIRDGTKPVRKTNAKGETVTEYDTMKVDGKPVDYDNIDVVLTKGSTATGFITYDVNSSATFVSGGLSPRLLVVKTAKFEAEAPDMGGLGDDFGDDVPEAAAAATTDATTSAAATAAATTTVAEGDALDAAALGL